MDYSAASPSTSSSPTVRPGKLARFTTPVSPTLSASPRADSTHSPFPPSETQVASRFLACFRCRQKKAKCDNTQPSCTTCTKASLECVRPTGRRRKRTRKEMERARAEGRENYARWLECDMSIYRDDHQLENPPKRARLSVDVGSATYGRSYSNDGNSPTSASSYQYPQIQNSRPYLEAFFPPTLPVPYHCVAIPYIAQTPHISRSAPSVIPYSPSMYSGQLPYTQQLPATDDSSQAYQDRLYNASITTTTTPIDHHSPYDQVQSHTMEPGPTLPKREDLNAAVRSLKEQVGLLEGNLGESQTLKVHYYRLTGCTAINPGFNPIAITLRNAPISPTSCSSPGSLASGHGSPLLIEEDISENPPPLDNIMLDTFFTYFGEQCPFMRRDKVEERVTAGTMSTFLRFSMCAVAVRFIPNVKTKPSQFIDAAWKLVLPLLRLPSIDVVAGLLMLSWAEFGENSESGLWNFLGLAIRMAQDLGLHKSENPDVIPIDDVCNGKVLFWSLFIMDRILAFGTGRVVSIPSESIDISPLNEIDLVGLAPSANLTASEHQSPYVYIVKLFDLAGHIANCMNDNIPPTKKTTGGETLQSLHNQLVNFIAKLPKSLTWSVDNFRAQAARHQGGSFLFFHLWTNAILALLHLPDLGRECTSDTGVESGLKPSIKLCLASSRQIVDCVVFADLFDERSYCAFPFINQCLFIAGMAFVHDAKDIPDGVEGRTSEFVCGLVKQNLSIVLRTLKKMEKYWSGLGYIISILEQRANRQEWSKVDFSMTSSSRFISLPDMGLMRKLMGEMHNEERQHQSPLEGNPAGALISQALQEQSLAEYGPASWSFDSLLGSQ